jgi:UDP-N-acetylglucosamine 2-epimerase
VLFCPTEEAVLNLAGEGIRHGKGDRWVKQVGDVMHDAILFYSRIADQKSTLLQEMGIAAGDGRRKRDFYLATIHRAENTDDPERLKSILRALDEIGKKIPVVLPLHPRTRKRMEAIHLDPGRGNVVILEPVSYLNMLKLEKDARAILTDSGGIQKEAYWLRVPCVTLREVTEWGYTVESGWNTLAGWKTRDILRAVRDLSRSGGIKEKIPREKPASDKIVRILYDRIRQKGNRGRKSRLS